MFLCSKKDEGVFAPWEKIKGIIYLLTLNINSVCIYKNEQPITVAHFLLMRL